MTRLMGFLEAMETYGKTIDVFVNVSNFVAFTWVGVHPCKTITVTEPT